MKLVSLAFLAVLAAQEPATLRRTLKADATDMYKIVDQAVQTVKSPLGDQTVTVSSMKTYALKTTKVDEAAGTAAFEATTTFDKIEMDGPAAGMMGEKPKPSVATGKIDVRGRMTFDQTAGVDSIQSLLSGAQSGALAGNFVELPERAVRIGDKWDIVVPRNPLVLDTDQKLSATLVGQKELDGVPVWVVSVKGVLRSLVDTAKLPKSASPTPMPAMRLRGETTLDGEGLVEKSTGKTLSMETQGQSKATIELVDSGITLETSGTVGSKTTLQKPAA